MRETNIDQIKKAKAKCETTINIDKKIHEKISKAAEKFNVSKSHLITILLKLMARKEKPDEEAFDNTVKYQQSREKECWKTLHIVVYKPDYEFFDDARKLWKKSLSHLAAYVVEKYLDNLDENDIAEITDKNRHVGYYIRHFYYNDIPCLLTTWIVPQTPIEIPSG